MTDSVKRMVMSAIMLVSALSVVAQTTIYSTDFIETPSGASATINKGQWNSAATSWSSGYNNSFQTTGSAGTLTYTFSPAIDLSSYSNVTLKVYWGSPSNRPLKVGVNGGTDTQIDAVTSSAERNQVRTATTTLSVNSITSLMFSSSGGGNVYLFRLEIEGSGGSTPPTPQPGQPSNDATLSDLKVDGTTISGFSASTVSYTYTVPAGTTTVPTVTYTTNNDSASAVITAATSIPGSTTVVVTAADGTTTKTYTVQFSEAGSTPPTPPTPPTPSSLTLHETEVYETPIILGGYGGTLATYNGREYEVYYVNRDANGSNMSISLVSSDKNNGITTGTSNVQCAANDGWLTAKGNGNSSASDNVGAEFGTMVRRINMQATDSVVMRVKGFSELAIVAADNSNSDSKKMQVYVNGVAQNKPADNSVSIRRYPLSTSENVIKIGALGTSNSRFYGFSLQVAYVPKLKHLKGNDSTQVVLQTAAMKPITYYLKNRISDAELVWDGQAATGVSLVKGTNDTLYVQGTADCPVGTYHYTISAKDSTNTVVSSVSGSFSVESKVECTSGNMKLSVFANTAIKPVVFRCYTLDMNNVNYQWSGNSPVGLSFQKDATNHTMTLSGTPTVPGVYPCSVSLVGGNTLQDTITVKSDQPTTIPGKPTLLYLYKDNENDGLYNYIVSSRQYGYFARPAAGDMNAESAYTAYDAVVISEDVDATNKEVLEIIKSLRKPVLNMKVFTYSASRLGWGEPDNGSISNTAITIKQANHTIFSGLNATNGEVKVLSAVSGNKGLMPAEVNYAGTICLATAPKRGDNYDDDGEAQTIIHEVPTSMRGAKYISLPIGLGSTANLTADGKKLFDNIITYLTSSTSASVVAPTVRITSFVVNGVAGEIDQDAKTIQLNLPAGTDLTALTPQITLADAQLTYVTPGSGETVDFSDLHYGVTYIVSDYITKVRYTVKARVASGLEEVDADGLWVGGDVLHNTQSVWVKIYSMDGQLLTTTNSDFSFEGQPRGMYIVRSENSVVKVLP